jgi:hypothetical protein
MTGAASRTYPSRFLVVGCGHTGTTLISGILHINGYGSFDVSPQFENRRLNRLNDRLLDGSSPDEREIVDFFADVERRTGGRWALKDPRLSETIERFFPRLPHPVGIVFNFRDPGSTVDTLYRERQMFLRHMTHEEMVTDSEDEYLRRNRAVLRFMDEHGAVPVLMVNYDELVNGSMDEVVCRFVGRTLDTSFADVSLRRARPMPVRQELTDLYHELLGRYEKNRADILRTSDPVPLAAHRGRTVRTRFYLTRSRFSDRIVERVGRLRSRTRSTTG